MESRRGPRDGSGDAPRRPRRGAAGRSPTSTPKAQGDADSVRESSKLGAASRANGAGASVWTGGSRILAALPDAEIDALRPKLFTVTLDSGQILYEAGSQIESVYFPDNAVASLLSRMENGAVIEVGTIGNEGVIGLGIFLGANVSVPETLTQVAGCAHKMSAADFRAAAQRLPALRALLFRCTNAFMTQVSQTAACNRLHGIDQRCARWLLMTHDRVGGDDRFHLTHQFLSYMLGVRRAGVTEALGVLAVAGLIASAAGTITILDRAGLELASCECYAIVRAHAGEPFADAV